MVAVLQVKLTDYIRRGFFLCEGKVQGLPVFPIAQSVRDDREDGLVLEQTVGSAQILKNK